MSILETKRIRHYCLVLYVFLKLTSRRVEVHAVIAMPSEAKESTKTITKTMINPLKRMEAEPCCRASVLVL